MWLSRVWLPQAPPLRKFKLMAVTFEEENIKSLEASDVVIRCAVWSKPGYPPKWVLERPKPRAQPVNVESVKAAPPPVLAGTSRIDHCLSLWTTGPRWLAFPDDSHSSQLLSLAAFPVYNLPEDVTLSTNCRLDLSLPFFP